MTQSQNFKSPIQITTYNVLSSHLSEPDFYTFCNPLFLDPKYRFVQLKIKLEEEIAKQSIICLQEVSQQWAGSLHSFFAQHGYYFICGLYGSKFNGYMGVGIAVPLNKFEIADVDISRISDTKFVPKTPKPSMFLQYFRQWLVKPWISLLTAIRIFKPVENAWDLAINRMNKMITVRLTPRTIRSLTDDSSSTNANASASENTSSDNSESASPPVCAPGSFVVGNYHMPCMFNQPAVMSIHCALIAQHIHKFARGDPYVLTGDFNIKPRDAMYTLLTEGRISPEDPSYPTTLPGDTWQLTTMPLRSAYKQILGAEPAFTNWAKNKWGPVFKDTLDYIFCSPEWVVRSVRKLNGRGDTTAPETTATTSESESGSGDDTDPAGLAGIEGPLPVANEPSDHVLLSAVLSL